MGQGEVAYLRTEKLRPYKVTRIPPGTQDWESRDSHITVEPWISHSTSLSLSFCGWLIPPDEAVGTDQVL